MERAFFEAEWGRVAPLVHDGGVIRRINSLWMQPGRTDFLQRVVRVFEPKLEGVENYADPKTVAKFPIQVLENVVSEQEERRRLILETAFYQRAAFALHAKIGTLPNEVPPSVVGKGIQVWGHFVKEMRKIMKEYDGGQIAKPRWFNKIPRRPNGLVGLRHEGKYGPIQEALTSLEEIRIKNPSIRQKVNRLMRETVVSVDAAIGIQNGI